MSRIRQLPSTNRTAISPLYSTSLVALALLTACNAATMEPGESTATATAQNESSELDNPVATNIGDEKDSWTVADYPSEWAGSCPEDEPRAVARPDHWSIPTHCVGVDADYDLLFDDEAVQRIDIRIEPDVHAAMQADLDEILDGGGSMPMPGGNLDSAASPMWGNVTIEHDGNTWDEVAMRYKGNSSLRSAYNSGIKKYSFRLSFDKYEEESPTHLDQRFYGFKKMTFSNGFSDPSLIRDKIAADIFRDAGIPAARGSFAAVFVDHGDGPVYFGLYTMVEDLSNRFLDTQFEKDSGNLYKPENDGATWETFVEADFPKKTNEEESDFSDIQHAIDVLNSDRSDMSAWKSSFEELFDVQHFLKLMAVNQVLVNWDSYGAMTHNYYVYGDPSRDGRFVWIPWDLNEAMLFKGGGPGGSSAVSSGDLDLTSIGSQWPVINNLFADADYRADYDGYVVDLMQGAFEQESVQDRMTRYHDLIAPYVVGGDGERGPYTFLRNVDEFDTSLSDASSGLHSHVEARHALVDSSY